MQQQNLIAAGSSPMAAISVTILPDASLETDAKVSSHLKMTVPASWIQKKRPMRKLLDAALKQWQLTDRSYALRRKDGTALDLDASLGTLEEGAKLVVGVAASAPVAPPKPQTPAPPKPSKAYATLRSGARIPLCGLGTGGVPGLVGEQDDEAVGHGLVVVGHVALLSPHGSHRRSTPQRRAARDRPGGRDQAGRSVNEIVQVGLRRSGCWVLDGILPGNEAEISSGAMVE